ncbi:beta-2-glycoprotein 1-like [Cololabis saira]|uniref:beta-2-glycoprotein 1-like n=1 Tax=Cololabis saira TaxID=129043 RepID=UPI002AD44540|nr:beta-2-glycoprotein 1-like [Cololabis saira]
MALFLLSSLLLFTTVTSEQDNVCFVPELAANLEIADHQEYFNPGVGLALSCKLGYTPVSGPRKIICTVSGEWTKTKLMCIPKRCPYPDAPSNGDLYYEDTVYQSEINYTCSEGYMLTGASNAVCQANGTWSTPVPECIAVSCALAPVPQFGMVIYDKRVRGSTTDYRTTAVYICRPPYAVFGDPIAECTANGTWTNTPECRVVTCPPPENIERGYMSSSGKPDYDYKETVKYGCEGDHVLVGNLEIVCQADGTWSEKPSCKAPCSVGIQRGRILHKGKKIWVKHLQPNLVLHQEVVSVYCMNKDRNCGYAVPTQCFDGTLRIPECFEEPSALQYNLNASSLPSEIEQC